MRKNILRWKICLLYTSDAADEEDSVDLGGRRIIKKKNKRRKRDDRIKQQQKKTMRKEPNELHKNDGENAAKHRQ